MNILEKNSQEREIILLEYLKNKNYNEELFFIIIENMDKSDFDYIKNYLFLYLGKKENNDLLKKIIKKFNTKFSIFDFSNNHIIKEYKEEIIKELYLKDIDNININNIKSDFKLLIEKIKLEQVIKNF